MRDPHVDAIYYIITAGDGFSYNNPKDLEFDTHLGRFSVSNGYLQVTPSEHFSDEKDARDAIDPFLRTWEVNTDLVRNVGMLRFRFDKTDVIDRDPPSPGSPQVIDVKGTAIACSTFTASVHITCSEYPRPPTRFNATLEVMHAYRRWLRFRDGKEPLQSMCYFVLTIAESHASSRKNAAAEHQIDFAILDKIGQLSSTRGDETTARKADAHNHYRELSSKEKQWLEAAIRLIIRRLGERASGGALNKITLADLPDL